MATESSHLGLRIRLKTRETTEGPRLYDSELDNCLVAGAGTVVDDLPVVIGASIQRCKVFSCNLTKLWFRDCVVSDTTWKGVMIIDGCVLERCILRGRLGALNIASRALDRSVDCSVAYGSYSDWALDISEARLDSTCIWGIPSSLIRRDPASQAIITRRAVLAHPDWRSVADRGSRLVIADMLRGNAEDAVFVAALKSRDAEKDLEVIARLRDAGIAEPD